MRIFPQTLAAFLLLAGCSAVNAHDFTVTLNGQKVFFNIKSQTDHTAEVTYNGNIADKRSSNVEGTIEIPAKVKHNNIVYSVVGVGAKSFSGATRLTGIVLPSSVKTISDFAFEGCTSLRNIVFPGNPVSFGQGVFFKCTAIKNVTLGSDWKSLDLAMFRWSDSLTNVTIPAKIEKIQNIKMLKKLQVVEVDANNTKFTSYQGVLYSKDGKNLYSCPRSYSGVLNIKEGTVNVSKNALIDCPFITQIDFPTTIEKFSFREPSRMENLQRLLFRGAFPPVTAQANNGEAKFLLQTVNDKVQIVVSNSAKKEYKSSLVQTSGEYSETGDTNNTPYLVKVGQMPKANNIIGVKNFMKYE